MKEYIGFWTILVVAFAFFLVLSGFDSITIAGMELKGAGMIDRLTEVSEVSEMSEMPEGMDSYLAVNDPKSNPDPASVSAPAPAPKSKAIDQNPQTILFIGDSMFEGLSPRLAAYAKANGHKLYSVMWYSSSSQVWGETDKLAEYIKQFKPTFIFISLGANELFVRDIAKRRDKYVKNIISQIGNIPYVWIGPPNWKKDTGINDLIRKNTAKGCFFLSDGMHFNRSKDGAHPTRKSAQQWMDSVARWMPANAAHPIKMDTPTNSTGKPERLIVLPPKK